jgi:hypothetical protein
MSTEHHANAKVVNQRWKGKYDLVCDVVLNQRVVTGVTVEASPPVRG